MLCMWPCSSCGWCGSFSPSVHSHKVEIWLLTHTQPPHSKSAQFIRISWGTPPLPFPSCCRFYHIRLLHNPSITLTECAVSCGSLQSACYVITHFVQTQGFFPQSQHVSALAWSYALTNTTHADYRLCSPCLCLGNSPNKSLSTFAMQSACIILKPFGNCLVLHTNSSIKSSQELLPTPIFQALNSQSFNLLAVVNHHGDNSAHSYFPDFGFTSHLIS